jgi:hypothetical protein
MRCGGDERRQERSPRRVDRTLCTRAKGRGGKNVFKFYRQLS